MSSEFSTLRTSLEMRKLQLITTWECQRMTLAAVLGKSISKANYKASAEKFTTIFMKDNSKIIFITDGADLSTT